MTVKKMTLAEAAAAVLQQAAKSGQEPMHTIPKGEVRDLGGSTNDDPEGGEVGKKASANASKAPPPGGKAPKVGSQAAGSVPGGQPQQAVSALAKPTMATASGNAPASTKGAAVSKTPSQTGSIPTAQKEEAEVEGEEVVETEETAEVATEEVATEEEVPELTAEEVEAAKQARLEVIREKMKSISCEEDINAIFSGQEGLSEEFKTTVTTIFEAAVIARAVLVVENLEQDILAAAEQTVDEIKEDLEHTVDAYLEHMVEDWTKKNEVAIEAGLRQEIVEEFLGGLKALFIEHHIDIPADDVSAVEALTLQVEELQGKMNDVLNTNVELTNRINEAKKVEVVSKICEGLTATQVEKVKTLAEGVKFSTEAEYAEKLTIIREQYFSGTTQVKKVATQVDAGDQEASVVTEEVSGAMAMYVNAIKKTIVS